MSTATLRRGTSRRKQGIAENAKKFFSFVWPLAFSAAAFVGLWYFASYAVLPDRVAFILPPFHEVVDRGVLTWLNSQKIFEGLWATTQVVLTGLAISITVGTLLAILMCQARWIERSLFPYAVALQALPVVATVPLFGALWGFGFNSQVVVTVIISLFPIISNTAFGLRCADPNLLDLMTLNGAGRFVRLWKLQFPSALPAFFTGLRIAAGLAVVGTIVGEFFFGGVTVKGLGRLIREDFKLAAGQGPQLYASIFWTCALGLVLFWIFTGIGRQVTKHWQD